MNLKRYQSKDTVRLCKGNFCLEASGLNARTLIVAVCIAVILMGLAALTRAAR